MRLEPMTLRLLPESNETHIEAFDAGQLESKGFVHRPMGDEKKVSESFSLLGQGSDSSKAPFTRIQELHSPLQNGDNFLGADAETRVEGRSSTRLADETPRESRLLHQHHHQHQHRDTEMKFAENAFLQIVEFPDGQLSGAPGVSPHSFHASFIPYPSLRHLHSPRRRVDGGRSLSGESRRFFATSISIALFVSAVLPLSHGGDLFSRQRPGHTCSQETCTASYTNSMEYVERGANPQFCTVLKTYLECMRQTNRACKGNLYYHSMSVLILNWMNQFNCSSMGLHSGRRPTGMTRNPLPPTPTAMRVCTFKGERVFKHCGLFGDPHLRTFSDEFQTCKVEGAWPLIDNDYLVVQVTNNAVVHRSSATATSKLTVIIKGNTPCSDEKTYQATTGNLPSAFVDGHTTSGPDKSVQIVEMRRGRHVEIHVRYVATTVIVRQVGQFLTFAIRMPRIIIHKRHPTSNNGNDVGLLPVSTPNLQLCVRGCPYSERINYREFLSYPNQKLKTLMRHNEIAMTRELAIIKCRKAEVVDQYFDSCVFDLMTTGDANFTLAASSALKDVMQLHPGPVFENRTSLVTHYPLRGRNGASLLTLSMSLTLLWLFVAAMT